MGSVCSVPVILASQPESRMQCRNADLSFLTGLRPKLYVTCTKSFFAPQPDSGHGSEEEATPPGKVTSVCLSLFHKYSGPMWSMSVKSNGEYVVVGGTAGNDMTDLFLQSGATKWISDSGLVQENPTPSCTCCIMLQHPEGWYRERHNRMVLSWMSDVSRIAIVHLISDPSSGDEDYDEKVIAAEAVREALAESGISVDSVCSWLEGRNHLPF